ncbi:uncharacterized protein A1O9_04389 [Exophiala aquamarina CBS 119918]|uniref:2-hydroxyacyl-CoA lyase n=1 Tax=Exophiala aquamarina CBS 119918 TaxID=1182545 RepID=A0A072PVE1_9EURO|nr:uncharacterized protein A1O9_04389 [Exophiala aquamarina CBS 119918]KEF59545.1 hypothetical protein A1O9_04389 [Exophiala aquamarina CBS 119918]
MAPLTGAKVIAQALDDLDVTVLHTLVGIPVADIAEEAIDLGIRVIGYRNEQACSYAASIYGYLTGRPGVLLLTGGPGIIHGMAGITNASTNAFPLLVLGGSSETTSVTKGGFQELDAVALLTPHTKTAIRPSSKQPSAIVAAIRTAYRIAWYGRPGPTFVDLPTDLIMEASPRVRDIDRPSISVSAPPKPAASSDVIASAVRLIQSSSAPLVIIGKGAAYARAESTARSLISTHHLPFLPTPMGKGVVPDSHPLNASSARTAALKNADLILLLGARPNWILHFGEAPRYQPGVKIIQVDISPEELGRANSLGVPALSIFGDIGLVVDQLRAELHAWKAFSEPRFVADPSPGRPSYLNLLAQSAAKNSTKAIKAAEKPTPQGGFLTYERAYHIIKSAIHDLSPSSQGGIVYVSEGANTMDISRSSFPLEQPRQRLDAGTWGTMGIGMGYAIAAWSAYNLHDRTKKIVALEGDSAFGFSGMEIETMARHRMDIVIIVMNNSGIYKGDATSAAQWKEMQRRTSSNDSTTSSPKDRSKSLRSSSLLYETKYEQLAEMVGGKGFFIRSEQELKSAVREAFLEKEKVPCVLNVIIDPGLNMGASFGWLDLKEKHGGGGQSKL